MAKKLTQAERRNILLYSSFTDDELDDPRVIAAAENLKRKEEQRRQEELKRRWDNVTGGVTTSEPNTQELQNTAAAPPAWAGLAAANPFVGIPAAAAYAGKQIVENPGDFFGAISSNLASATHGLVGGVNRMDADATRRALELSNDPGQMDSVGDAYLLALTSPIAPLFEMAGGDKWADAADTRANQANARQDAAAAEAKRHTENIDWFGGQTLASAISGVANPQSLSSFVPGVGPELAAALGYPASYNELRRNNATPEQAMLGAFPSALAEYGGAKLGNAIRIPAPQLGNTAYRAGVHAVENTLKETVGEDLTSLLQSGNYAAIADNVDNDKLEAYANMRAGQWGQDLWQATVGSLVLGGTHAAPSAYMQYSAEQGAYAQQQLRGFADARATTEAIRKRKADELEAVNKAAESFNTQPVGATAVNPAQRTPNTFIPPANFNAENFAKLQANPEPSEDALIDVQELQRLRDASRGAPVVEEDATTPEMVWQALADKRGTRDSNIATTLLDRKKVKIVDDASEIPGGATPVGTAGWYDGDNTYVVASSLNKDNILPELMSIMGHEVKHGVDASGYEHVLGKTANDALVNQATKLANDGDTRAIEAFRSATGGEDFGKSLSETEKRELVSYSINNAMDDNTGGWGAIKRTAAAAWRAKARDLGINKDDVKIEDLRYLTKSMLESVAMSDRSLQGQIPQGGDGQPMIVSNGLNAAKAELEGRAYKSADGAMKYFVSDRDSSITMPKNTMAPKKLDRVLQHSSLYDELPELRGVNVVFENEPGVSHLGRFDANAGPQGTIYLNKAKLGDDTSQYGPLHRILLHEVQHAAQGVSNTTNGGNPYMFMSTAALELKGKIDDGTASAEEVSKYDKAYAKAYKTYRKILGEQEAHFTADNAEALQSDLDEDFGGVGPEGRFAKWHSGIIAPDAKPLVPNPNRTTVDPNAPAGWGEAGTTTPQVVGMAQIITPRDKAQASADTDSLRDKAHSLTNKDGRFNDLYRTFARIVYGDRGLGRQLNELELSVGNQAASLATKGAQLDSDLESAINKAAATDGFDYDKVMKRVDEVITKADLNPSRAQRKSAIATLDREFPDTKLGTRLNLIRENNWEMQSKLIDYRIADGRPLTKKELNTYKKMIEREERWTTRAYQSQMGGRELYAKAFEKRMKDPNSQESQNLKAALGVLKAEYLSIPSGKELDALNVDKLKQLYKAWDVGNSRSLKATEADSIDALGDSPETKAFLLEKLNFLRNVSGERLESKAMEVAKDLIGINKQAGAAANMIRGMRQNRTVLEARSKIPKAIRSIMGEVTDPRLRLAISTARLTQIVATTRALTDAYKQGEGVWWSNEKTDKFSEPLSSESYGPLDGKYVSRDMNDMLGAYTKYNETFDSALQDTLKSPGKAAGKALETAGRGAHALSSWAKFSSIVSNPASGLLNFVGSGMTLVKNGIANPITAGKALHDTASLFLTAGLRNANSERMALNQELLLAGVVDSAQAQELRSKEFKSIAHELRDMNTDSKIAHFKNRVGDVLNTAKGGVGTMYAFMDVWTKTATYYQNRDSREAYYKAEGMDVPREQIIREAGYDTTLSTISYNRASPLVKAIERNIPFGGAFATYNAEAIRSTIGGLQVVKQYAQMAKDAKTPEGKRIATGRALQQLGGTLAATAGVIAGTTYLLNTADEEDKKKRKLFADWEQDKIHYFIGKDESGREHYASINRADPIGPVNEPIVSFIQAMQEDGGTIGDATMAALDNYGTTLANTTNFYRLFSDLAKETFGSGPSRYTKESALERAAPDTADAVKNAMPYGNAGANLLNIADTVTPSWAIGILDPERLNVKGDGENTAKWAKNLGYKDVVVDPQKSLGFRADDYNKGIKKLQAERDKMLRSTSNPDAIMENIKGLIDEERELFTNLSEATLSYREFSKPAFMDGIAQDRKQKLDEDNAYDVLKGRRVAKDVLGDVIQGTFIPTVVNDELVDKWVKAQQDKVETNDPDYAQKMEDIENKATLLEQSLRLDGSDD